MYNRYNKYRNHKTEKDGILFDSKKESERYDELKTLQQAGAISDLVLQPSFILQESFKRDGKTERAITYRADFKYMQDGKIVVEDVKGMETDVFKIKEKLFLRRYPDIDFRKVR